MKEIALHGRLGRGKFALVDDEDYYWLNRYTWFAHTKNDDPRIYAATQIWIGGKKRFISMHRFIKNAPPSRLIDHWDNDRLNNQKDNLRPCTPSENGGNRLSSWHKGVSYDKRSDAWWARIGFNHQQIHLGTYETEYEAAIAYNHAALEYFKEFANFNDVPGWENTHPLTRKEIRMNQPKKVYQKTYKAEIEVDGKVLPLGVFDTPEKAETAILMAKKLYNRDQDV